MKSWDRDDQHWRHVNGHLVNYSWPTRCPHPRCTGVLANDAQELRYHFIDAHFFSRSGSGIPRATVPAADQASSEPQVLSSHPPFSVPSKRKTPDDTEGLTWMPLEKSGSSCIVGLSRKKARKLDQTIDPSLMSLGHRTIGDPYPQGTSSLSARSSRLGDMEEPDNINSNPASVTTSHLTNDVSDTDSIVCSDTSLNFYDAEFVGLSSETQYPPSAGDDAMFSAFLRSPSPILILDNEDNGQPDDCVSTSVVSSHSDHGILEKQGPPEKLAPAAIRIRLHVKPPGCKKVSAIPHTEKEQLCGHRDPEIKPRLRLNAPKVGVSTNKKACRAGTRSKKKDRKQESCRRLVNRI